MRRKKNGFYFPLFSLLILRIPAFGRPLQGSVGEFVVDIHWFLQYFGEEGRKVKIPSAGLDFDTH